MMPMAQKTVADEVGVQHQVCKAHVLRNIDALIERYQPLVASDADGSLHAIGMGPQQAAADLTRLGELVRSRQREQATELEALHRRCLQACPPQEGERQSMAYRLRLLFLVELRFLLSTLLLDMKHDATDRFMRDTIRCCHGTERFFTAAPRSTSGKREDRMPDALVLDGGA